MYRSVPQMEAAFTHTSTSVGPIAGTATVSNCKPRAGCIFRNAFIVAAIYPGPRPTHKPSMLTHRHGPVLRGAACRAPSCRHFLMSCLRDRIFFLSEPRLGSLPPHFLFHLFYASNLLERLQILEHQFQGHRSIFCRNRIANLLRTPLPIGKIQHFIGVFLAASPPSLVAQQFRRRNACRFRVILKVVIPKHRQRSLWPGLPLKPNQVRAPWNWTRSLQGVQGIAHKGNSAVGLQVLGHSSREESKQRIAHRLFLSSPELCVACQVFITKSISANQRLRNATIASLFIEFPERRGVCISKISEKIPARRTKESRAFQLRRIDVRRR